MRPCVIDSGPMPCWHRRIRSRTERVTVFEQSRKFSDPKHVASSKTSGVFTSVISQQAIAFASSSKSYVAEREDRKENGAGSPAVARL